MSDVREKGSCLVLNHSKEVVALVNDESVYNGINSRDHSPFIQSS